MTRVVLDANVVISGLVAPLGAPAAILDAWYAEYLEPVVCPGLLEEIAEKLRLPRIRDKYQISEDEVVRLLTRFSQAAILVPGLAPVTPPPDPDDTMLFAAATESAAEFIITGDKVLLTYAWGGPGKVISPKQFWVEEFPQRLKLDLHFPVYALEDLAGRAFSSVEVAGHTCLALFMSRQAVSAYCLQNQSLAQELILPGPDQLEPYLRRVATGGCEWVAFNPIRRYAIIQPIALTLESLRRGASARDSAPNSDPSPGR
jgi:putative PIN family toxin of toxin-antitoxin system